MQSVIVLLLATLLATFVSAEFVTKMLSEEKLLQKWASFKAKHNKLYSAEEHDRRFTIFAQNVRDAYKMNRLVEDHVYGITQFSDMTSDEFRAHFLMKTPIDASRMPRMDERLESYKSRSSDPLPDSWNWVEKGAVTPVKNQGQCGSCWSFSTTGNIEGQNFLKSGHLVSLSEQQFVDCDHTCDPQDKSSCDQGCNGGLMLNAFRYATENGVEPETRYPYTAMDGTCKYNASAVAVRISGGMQLPTDEDQLTQWLHDNGPIAVALNAEWLQTYVGGISKPLFCDPKKLDHGVLIVGYGVGKTVFGKTEKYWLVKNSWGTGWGESCGQNSTKGCFRMARGFGTCGINTYACSAKM